MLLYQLLCGRFPYEPAERSGAYELERLICETEPSRPSAVITQVTDDAAGNESASVSGARSMPSATQLRNELKGDLDNIVMMAMRKEPERRYAAVGQLARGRAELPGPPTGACER
ncbi:MAG: hypothetical protein U5K76_03015 [Woeseiaceae bacterium]|nr:hypothetical protein [Woeseiaceae bacterium]